MVTYKTPGVHIENVLSEPARILRTGVPVFLGLVDTKGLLCEEELTSELAETFVCKPIADSPGVSIVRNRNYLSLPQRTFAPPADLRIPSRSSGDQSIYLKAPVQRARAPTRATAGTGGEATAPADMPPPLSPAEPSTLSAKPQRFTLWPQFEATYGALKPFGFLTYAVRGFFENGGSLCYVQVIGYTHRISLALDAGLATLAPYDDYDLVCVPDIMWQDRTTTPGSQDALALTGLQSAVLEHCRQLGDRMAILDSLPQVDIETVRAKRRRIQGDNGALYYPWVRVQGGPLLTEGYVPPCGHVAGIYARCDQRTGVHKAPANEIVEGVLELQTTLTDDQQGLLNDDSINCLRAFPRRGIRVWGARTLSAGPTWRYVNGRRVILTAARWIERNLTDILFEPHTPRLWDRIVRELTAYFTDLVSRGALSAPPDGQAFYVKCDAETNPRAIQDAGMVVTEIGLRPAAPAEFIVIRILHGPTGVQIEDVGP